MRWFAAFLAFWAALPAALRWGGVVAEMALLWLLSSRQPLVATSSNAGAMLHNSAHVVAYAAMGAMALLAQVGRRPVGPHHRWLAVVLSAGYGALDELHQGFVPGRVQSLSDFGSDLSGALLGMLLVQAVRSGERRWNPLIGAALVGAIGCVTLATFTDW